MKTVLETLKAHIEQHPPSYGDADSVLAMLYECHNECNPYDNEQIRADFEALYQRMPLQEVDRVIYPVCTLCRDHERAGFVEGVRMGVLLAQEVGR